MLADKVKEIAKKLTHKVSLELDLGTTFQSAKLKWLGFTYLTQSDLEEINKIAESLGIKVSEYYIRDGLKVCFDDPRAFEGLCKEFEELFKDTIISLSQIEIKTYNIKLKCLLSRTFIDPNNLIKDLTIICQRLKNEGFTTRYIDFLELDEYLGALVFKIVCDLE